MGMFLAGVITTLSLVFLVLLVIFRKQKQKPEISIWDGLGDGFEPNPW